MKKPKEQTTSEVDVRMEIAQSIGLIEVARDNILLVCETSGVDDYSRGVIIGTASSITDLMDSLEEYLKEIMPEYPAVKAAKKKS